MAAGVNTDVLSEGLQGMGFEQVSSTATPALTVSVMRNIAKTQALVIQLVNSSHDFLYMHMLAQ